MTSITAGASRTTPAGASLRTAGHAVGGTADRASRIALSGRVPGAGR